MGKQYKKPPPKAIHIGSKEIELTKKGTRKMPWHLQGNASAKGTGFDKRPENAGRKKKIYTVLKEKGYSKDDIVTAFGELAFYSISEINAVKKNLKKPIITRIIANQFAQAYADSDWFKIKEIMEHVIGKPIQSVHNINENIEITFED